MGSIIAIGGGEFTRREIDRLDLRTKELTGKEHPTMLYIPTASCDEEIDLYDEYYSELGFKLEKLLLIRDNPDEKTIREAVFSADCIFAGGGDAILLMKEWKKHSLDSVIREAFRTTDIVLSGISAGSICWFSLGHTDSLSYYRKDWDYLKMEGIGLIPAFHSPHFCRERADSLEKFMRHETLPGVGLDNGCALEFSDGSYKIITSMDTARAHIYRSNADNTCSVEILKDADTLIL